MELSLARQYDLILLKDGFQFFFNESPRRKRTGYSKDNNKQSSEYDPVPNY